MRSPWLTAACLSPWWLHGPWGTPLWSIRKGSEASACRGVRHRDLSGGPLWSLLTPSAPGLLGASRDGQKEAREEDEANQEDDDGGRVWPMGLRPGLGSTGPNQVIVPT